MSFASPQKNPFPCPSDALFRAHLQSSILMAVYLIVGAALTVVAALLGLANPIPLQGNWGMLPSALMVTVLLWFGAGALLLHWHQKHLQRCVHDYQASLPCHTLHSRTKAQPTAVTPTAVASAPWELRAFGGHAAGSAQRHAQTAQVPSPVHLSPPAWPAPRQATTSNAFSDNAAPATNTLEVDLIASMTEHKPLRPVSLFGSVQ